MVGGGLIIAALAVLLFGSGETDRAAADPPPITLLEPPSGAEVAAPLALDFRVPVPMQPGTDGWQAGPFHLHAAVDSFEAMATAASVEALGEDRYRWTFHALRPGEYTLRLFWSDMEHQPVAGGGSRPVSVIIQPSPTP